jgi:hypothetical protein
VASGEDPIAEKKDNALRGTTLQETFDDYLKTRKDLKPGTIKDYTRCIKSGYGDWLDKPLMEITKDMVELRHREMGKRSHARANNTMRVLRALFNHAKNKLEDSDGNPFILSNPVDRLSRNRSWCKVARRGTKSRWCLPLAFTTFHASV